MSGVLCMVMLLLNATPAFADPPFDAVPNGQEGYVPDAQPTEKVDSPETDDQDGGIISRFVANVIDGITAVVEWAIGGTDLKSVLFGKIDPLSGKEFGSNAVGNVFSADEWNNAVNPLRLAFTFVAWVFFVIIIARYGLRLMRESTNPIQRANLLESLYAWIGAAALLAFMYMLVFIVFNLNAAFVQGLSNLIGDNDSFGSVFDVLSTNEENITGGPIGDAIVNFGLAIMACVLLVQYIFRQFIIAFLVIIGPMATLSYARNKEGGAFKVWLAELLSQVFIQSAHCLVIVLYFAFVNAAMNGTSAVLDLNGLDALGQSVRVVLDPVLKFLITIGGVVAIGALMLNGMRLSMSAGNPAARVQALKGVQLSLIGGLLCVGAVVAVNVLRGLMF
ncbi:MAG TPA: hypothetical protein VF199_14140 [Bacillales bacterium]